MTEALTVGRQFTTHWWVFGVRGILAIVFGLFFVFFPVAAILTLVILFGAYAFADGVMALVAAIRTGENRVWLIIEGIVGIAAALVTWFYPGITAYVLALTIAAWALVTGVMEIVLAVRLREQIANEIWLIVIGVLSIVLGLVLSLDPLLALRTWVLLVAIYAFIAGIAFIAFAFRLKSLSDRLPASGLKASETSV